MDAFKQTRSFLHIMRTHTHKFSVCFTRDLKQRYYQSYSQGHQSRTHRHKHTKPHTHIKKNKKTSNTPSQWCQINRMTSLCILSLLSKPPYPCYISSSSPSVSLLTSPSPSPPSIPPSSPSLHPLMCVFIFSILT